MTYLLPYHCSWCSAVKKPTTLFCSCSNPLFAHTHIHTDIHRHLQLHCTLLINTTCKSSYHIISPSIPSFHMVVSLYLWLKPQVLYITALSFPVDTACVCFKWCHYTSLHLHLCVVSGVVEWCPCTPLHSQLTPHV